MKRRIIIILLSLIVLSGNSYLSYKYGRSKGVAETYSMHLKSLNQSDAAVKALVNSPYMRVCVINARYRALLKKLNVDPEKYGVTE